MKMPNKKEFQQIGIELFIDIECSDFMKFYKSYTKGPFSCSVNNTILPLYNPLKFTKTLLWNDS